MAWLENWLSGRVQGVVKNRNSSDWRSVTSGLPPGSILGPMLFAIYINDLEDNFEDIVTIMKKFADDTKLAQEVKTEADRTILQTCLDQLWTWSTKWGMSFNTGKCHVLHLGQNNPLFEYSLGDSKLARVEEEKDIGVLINGNLKPGRQCEKVAQTANRVLSQVLEAFMYRDKEILPKIYKSYVRPHVEFAVPAWNPWSRGDVEVLENVQKRLVKQIQGLKGASYEDRLTELGMESLEERKAKIDIVQTFKIIHRHENVQRSTWFELLDAERQHRTRLAQGGLSLVAKRARLDLRQNFFSHKTVNMWNKLSPEQRSYSSVASFKHRIKKCHITVAPAE